MLFIGNSTTGESAWEPTNDEPIPYEGHIDIESRMGFSESLDTTTVSDSSDHVHELK